jgi:catechol 2,3-dioxygenase-like lactoylglutathione lyase family enzyme
VTRGVRMDHVDLVVGDLARSLEFYEGLLGPMGWTSTRRIDGERGEDVFYIGAESPGRDFALSLRSAQSPLGPYDRYSIGVHHLAFWAPSRTVVDERFSWVVSVGASIESEPQEYDYTDNYYAVFFYDPDGIKLEIVNK